MQQGLQLIARESRVTVSELSVGHALRVRHGSVVIEVRRSGSTNLRVVDSMGSMPLANVTPVVAAGMLVEPTRLGL